MQALRALGFLHRKGFVHRDISPDNLMLTRDVDGEPLVKLIDLGIVKILQGEGSRAPPRCSISASPATPRPSSCRQDIDARSDLYSFGVAALRAGHRRHPIHGHDLPSLITGHLYREPVAFEVSDPAARCRRRCAR